MMQSHIKKLYYSISEVSRITSLKKYILRYWETEFPELSPAKNRGGNRIYKLDDIKTIFLIKKLLYQEKYTIEGAKQKLKAIRKSKEDPQLHMSFAELRRDDALLEVKKRLIELREFLQQKSAAPPSKEEESKRAPGPRKRIFDPDASLFPDLDSGGSGPEQEPLD